MAKAAIAHNGAPARPELPKTRLQRKATIFELVRATLSKSVGRLVQLDPVLRAKPGIDEVHDARIAVRKLRSQLLMFVPVTDAAWNAELDEDFRWLGNVLGAARDADVLLAELTGPLEDLPINDRRHPEDPLAPFRLQREVAYRELERVLRDPRYTHLIEAAIAAASAPRVHRPQRTAASLLPQLMQRIWKKLRKRVRRSGAQPTDRDLHRIRIQTKHVRYAAESLIPINGDGARQFARRAKALQVLLGKQHDAVVAGIALHEHFANSAQTVLGSELAATERCAAIHLRERFPSYWKRLAKKRRHFWV